MDKTRENIFKENNLLGLEKCEEQILNSQGFLWVFIAHSPKMSLSPLTS